MTEPKAAPTIDAQSEPRRSPAVGPLLAALPRFSPARGILKEMLARLDTHTPEAPPGYEAWGLPRIAYTAAFLRRFVRPGHRLMDLASGPHFSFLVSGALPGVEWLATDAEAGSLEFRERSTGNVAFRYEPSHLMLGAERFTLPGNQNLDAVTLFEVVEHLQWNPASTFGSIAEGLRDGARLIVSTPNVCGRSPILKQLTGGSPHQTPFLKEGLWYHRKEYSPWELKQLFEWAGFDVECIHTANVYPGDPRGWRAFVHHTALLGAACLSLSPVEVRHLLKHSGSTQFVVGRKVRSPRWGQPTPDV